MNESVVSIDLFTEAQSNKDNNYENDTSFNETIPKKVESPSMLDVVSVSGADDSIPIKETSQKTYEKGVVRLTKVREGTSSQSESKSGVLHSVPIKGEGPEYIATLAKDLTEVVIVPDQ